jgi:outer membrane receptor protein involved in Fe transport
MLSGDGLIFKDGKSLKYFELSDDGKHFHFASAQINGNKIIVWNENVKDSIAFRYYKFNQNRIGLFELATNNYHLLNMGLNFEIATQNHPIEINAGIKNLFNTSYIDHLSRFRRLEIPNQGINFYLRLRVKFGKNIEKAD